ncbi:hypothetical protein K439DRAFT_1663343 [Ramaria rubella]|nr:hypothetical protein K439DRAFT_1663343 [Ramaria rubella]
MVPVAQVQLDSSSSQYTRRRSGEHGDEPSFPINRLPEDLLKHILEFTRNAHPLPPSGIGRERTAAAFRLSHVCQQWRRVAQDDALLWTDIDTTDMDLANRYLVLCKDAPIRLVLRFRGQFFVDYRLHYSERELALELLQRHLHHVQELRIHLHKYDLQSVLRALSESSFTDWSRTAPKLTALVVSALRRDPRAFIQDEFSELAANIATFPIFTDPPSQLLDISFHNIALPASSPIWDGKRTLNLWWCYEPSRSMSDYLDLIARSPNLTSLSISAGMCVGTPDSYPHLTATYLTKLTIADLFPTQIISFLDHIILPNIIELTIHVIDFPYNVDSEAGVDLLPLSQRSLDIFQEITTVTVGSRDYAPESEYPPPRMCATAWTGSCSDLRELFTATVPSCYEGRLNVCSDTLSLFPFLHTVVLKDLSRRFAWDLGTSHTVHTLRIENLFRGNRICVKVFKELERLKCLPRLNRIELVNITFLDEGFEQVLSAVEALLSHSHEPTFITSSCGFFSQRDHDDYLRSLGFERNPQISKVSKWEKFKFMTQRPLSSIREVWR